MKPTDKTIEDILNNLIDNFVAKDRAIGLASSIPNPEWEQTRAKATAQLNDLVLEARIKTVKEVSDKFDDLHQKTEGGGFVHYGEFGEWLDDRIKELQALRRQLDEGKE